MTIILNNVNLNRVNLNKVNGFYCTVFLATLLLLPFTVNAAPGDILIDGNIALQNGKREIVLTKSALSAMPKARIKTSTSWTPEAVFEGIPVADILERVGAQGSILRFHALNDYFVDIPVSDVETYHIILATTMDGKPLTVRNFGPYFVIYPIDAYRHELDRPRYHSRFIWQVNKISVQ